MSAKLFQIIGALKNKATNLQNNDPNISRDCTKLIQDFNTLSEKQISQLFTTDLNYSDLNVFLFTMHNLEKICLHSEVLIKSDVLLLMIQKIGQLSTGYLSTGRHVDVCSIDLSRNIFSLGKIADAGKLHKNIAIEDLSLLLKGASTPLSNNREKFDAPCIAQVIYGLGLLAKAKKLTGVLDDRDMEVLSKLLNALGEMALNAHDMSMIFYGLGELAKAGKLTIAIITTQLNPLCSTRNLANCEAQSIAMMIYGLGSLSRSGKLIGTVKESFLSALIQNLPNLRLMPQNISMTFYGLGELAKAKNLKAAITIAQLAPLFEQLHLKNCDAAQHLSNIIYGLGCLSQAGQLTGKVEENVLLAFIEALTKMQPSPQEISMTFYGLGELAKAKNLKAAITIAQLIEKVQLTHLENCGVQSISMMIYSLGNLSQAGKLIGTVKESFLPALIKKLSELQPSPQEISMTFYGLGELAKAEKLTIVITMEQLTPLLKTFNLAACEAQAISNIIYGLCSLSQAGKLTGTIQEDMLSALIKKLSELQPSPQNISMSLYGLGKLAKAKHLTAAITIDQFTPLLKQLNLEKCDAQHLSNIIYGLGSLSQGGQLTGTIQGDFLSALIKKLPEIRPRPTSQGISMTFYGLRALAKAKQLTDPIKNSEFLALVQCVDLKAGNAKYYIAQIIYSVGLLSKSGYLIKDKTSEAELSQCITELLGQKDFNLIDLNQIIRGIAFFQYKGDVNQINLLFEKRLQKFVHPSIALDLLTYYAVLVDFTNDKALAICMLLVNNICIISYEHFNQKQQKELEIIKEKLPETLKKVLETKLKFPDAGSEMDVDSPDFGAGNWEPMDEPFLVSSPVMPIVRSVPVHHPKPASNATVNVDTVPGWDKAINNKIFAAIHNGDLKKLEDLLHVSGHPTQIVTVSRNGSSHNTQATQNVPISNNPTHSLKIENDQLVSYFFENINAKLLMNLIKKVDSVHYFERILRACSKRQQYQFAINQQLYPVILYLSFHLLEAMNQNFIQLGFYRNHGAILSLVDALFLRKKQNPAESEVIQELQLQLLEKSIEHHQQHHEHATQNLKKYLVSIGSSNEKLFDINNEEFFEDDHDEEYCMGDDTVRSCGENNPSSNSNEHSPVSRKPPVSSSASTAPNARFFPPASSVGAVRPVSSVGAESRIRKRPMPAEMKAYGDFSSDPQDQSKKAPRRNF